jgi:hypothetical protein
MARGFSCFQTNKTNRSNGGGVKKGGGASILFNSQAFETLSIEQMTYVDSPCCQHPETGPRSNKTVTIKAQKTLFLHDCLLINLNPLVLRLFQTFQ